MKALSYVRLGTYALFLGALALAPEPTHFIPFENFPFMTERFDWFENEAPSDPWLEAFFERTGGLTHHTAAVIARNALVEAGASESVGSGVLFAFQRDAERGVFVIVFPDLISIGERDVVCVRVAENRSAEIIYSVYSRKQR